MYQELKLTESLSLLEGPATYEDMCELHRLVSTSLTDDLKKIEEGTYGGNEEDKVRVIRIAVKFLKDNKIIAEAKSPTQMLGILETLELPTFKDEVKA